MSDWPEHSQELARKAIETLHGAVHAHEVEKTMTAKELRLVINTIVDTTQGLVPSEVISLLMEFRKELDQNAE